MLENFDTLAKRPMVKDYVHKKAAEWVYKLFIDEIKEVEDMFDSQNKRPPPMPLSHPKHGGLAIWAQSLIVRIDRAKEVSIRYKLTHRSYKISNFWLSVTPCAQLIIYMT